jgi:3-isopropylmalate/(R)-2-methylmalate dehydratase large subunit
VSGQTLAEKILSEKSARRVKAGQLITSPVDLCTASDTTAPLAIRAFEEMCGGSAQARLAFPEKVVLVIDHAAPAPNERIANLHELMRRFARAQDCALFESGEGIIHHVVLEKNLAPVGSVVMGADSHTTTYGAWGSFAAGIGSTDAAAIWKTGCTWLKVPHSIRIELQGQLRPGVFAKDVMLHLLSRMGQQQANYQSIEFAGEAVEGLPLSERITLANMTAELGGKVGLVESRATLQADAGASYSKVIHVDVSALEPQVALPGSPAHGRALRDVEGQKVSLAFLGTCTNSRIEDLRIAASILKGKKIAQGVRLYISPASRQTLLQATQDGTLATLIESGAILLATGCGPCVGTHMGVPADGEVVISSGNRNFAGRMGNRNAQVYLASPAAVASAALTGCITSPEPLLAEART